MPRYTEFTSFDEGLSRFAEYRLGFQDGSAEVEMIKPNDKTRDETLIFITQKDEVVEVIHIQPNS